jgi:hypothetical protein
MAHVTDNSYDRDPLRIVRHAPHHDAFAKGILVRPEFLRERLIHDNDKRRICVVRVGEEAAFGQGRPECAKVIWRNLTSFFIRARAVIV